MQISQITQEKYNKIRPIQQIVLPLDYSLMMPEDEPVRLLDAVLEDLDYTELLHLYSLKGRKSTVSPHIFFKVFIFAMMEGIYSLRDMARQCEVNLQYKWLLPTHRTPSHTAFHRFFQKIPASVLEDLFV